MKADLHSHSIYSDGISTVAELVKHASEKHLDYLALTDHDSVEGVDEAIEEAKKYGITIIPGIEVSTNLNGSSIHILGYFNGDIPDSIRAYSKDIFTKRRERAKKMAENVVNIYGMKMDIDRLMSNQGMITRGHMIRELAESNPGYDRQFLFKTYLSEKSKAYIPSTKLTTEETIKMLRDAGALIVVAHPTLYSKEDREIVFNYDIDGIEAIYSKNVIGDEPEFRRIAAEKNLVITAGSDYHGIIDFAHDDLAVVYLEDEEVETFLKELRKK